MTNTWIIAIDENISSLVEIGRSIGGITTVISVGEVKIGEVDKVISIPIPKDMPLEAAAPAVVSAISAEEGDIVLSQNKPAGRSLAGAIAANLNAPLLIGVTEINDAQASMTRLGGIVDETVSFSSAVVAVLDGGIPVEGTPAQIEQTGGEMYPAQVTEINSDNSVETNLTTARKIVAVGRGFKDEKDLELAKDLAKAIGGEVACSRPIAEGTGWLPRDRYIGVSGQKVSPELYIAIGISGQIQHTAGMQDAETVVVVNSDETAPFFSGADYGIVGDLYETLPALVQAAAQ